MKPPVSEQEEKRLAALARYRVLDTQTEQAYDDIVKAASFVCGTPIALVSLIDERRQWFKARVGLDVAETPREQAFCVHTIAQMSTLVVEDATQDARFAENPLVTGEPKIRFYAGAPLVTPEGFGLGSLCVIDRQARRLDSKQIEILEALARVVVNALELRLVSRDLADQLAQVRTLTGLLPICIRCKNIRNDTGYWQRVESYVREHTEARFTMELCPACSEKHLPRGDGASPAKPSAA
jgi:GAF domain-containing protein